MVFARKRHLRRCGVLDWSACDLPSFPPPECIHEAPTFPSHRPEDLRCGRFGNVSRRQSPELGRLADVDEKRAAGTFEKFPKVQRFSEHRELLDQLGSKL